MGKSASPVAVVVGFKKKLATASKDNRKKAAIRKKAAVSSNRPNRPLSSYNLYFQIERQRIIDGTDHLPLQDIITCDLVQDIVLKHKTKTKRSHRKTHGIIGFIELNAKIAKRWKAFVAEAKATERETVDDEKTNKNNDKIAAARCLLEEQAKIEKQEYMKQVTEWQSKCDQNQVEESLSTSISSSRASNPIPTIIACSDSSIVSMDEDMRHKGFLGNDVDTDIDMINDNIITDEQQEEPEPQMSAKEDPSVHYQHGNSAMLDLVDPLLFHQVQDLANGPLEEDPLAHMSTKEMINQYYVCDRK
mmetsp:Transcript_7009/g.9116  ORF Transcript_7009/g.9116 Transcript_7009/m.9116 type:complete len:304 (+) Transcript_7009:63-974(+)